MKKSLFSAILGLTIILFAASCSKDDDNNTNPNNSSAQGTWTGTGQYAGGNPSYVFSLNLKANGTVDIVGNNSVAVDNATGTWQQVQDSVKVTYMYASSSAVYALSAKYSASSNVMTGNIGLSPATSGVGTFTVTKQ